MAKARRPPQERIFHRRVKISLTFYLAVTATTAAQATAQAADLLHEHVAIGLPELPTIADWEYRLTTGRAYPYFPEQESP